jgi:SAM-dependent methyltransferase
MRYVNKAIRIIVGIPLFWKIISPVVRFFKNVEYQRNLVVLKPVNDRIKNKVLLEPVVKNGLFKGLKYPVFEAAGSAVYPKFIGSYESELTPVFTTIIKQGYDTILDIGCAEGYYANGLALTNPQARVYAYDVDERARRICEQISKLNGLEGRVIIGSKMDAAGLGAFDLAGRKTLIISDCEGYEKALFTKQNISNLKNADVLIEVHDLFDMTISGYLKEIFNSTHHIQVLSSVDDIKKAQTYSFP